MLIAVVYTISTVLAIGAALSVILAGKREIDYSPGSAILATTLSFLGYWWCVSTLGFTGFMVFLLVWNSLMCVYIIASAFSKGMIYFPPLLAVASSAVQVWLVVLLWRAAA